MKNPFSKVLGLFTPKADTPTKPDAQSGSSCCSEPQADQNKSSGKGASSTVSSHCCGHSDTTKIPNIE
jgi:hypothetical protein